MMSRWKVAIVAALLGGAVVYMVREFTSGEWR